MKLTQTLFLAAMLSAGLLSTTGANAALVSVLGGQAINDTDLNITWLANANLAATNSFGLAYGVDIGNYGDPSFIFNTGNMTFGGAMKWIAAMNANNYLGYSDWRLPTTLLPDASCGYQDVSASYGYNCTGSELGHLFYNELGGVAAQSIATVHNANYSLFSNIKSSVYRSGTEYAPNNAYYDWGFFFLDGSQGVIGKSNANYVLPVRSGQVTAIPVPAAAWLLGSGLLGLIGVARRKAA